jgi:RNA polymerase sigma-B factor
MGDRHPILEPGADARRTRRCDTGRPVADRALLERYRQRRNPVDGDMLVERYLPLARALARRYQRTGEPLDDLFQVACLGLVKAIDRFDVNRDVAFATYAVPTMVGEIKRYLRDGAWSVRVPRGLQELSLRVETNVAELSGALHRQPTVAEIAHAAAATEKQVLEALQAAGAYRAASLQTPRAGEDGAGDTLGDSLASTEHGFDLTEDRATLAQLLRAITPREREALRLHFQENLTQREIGQRIGVSQMQTSRIIRHSIDRLHTAAHA